MSEKKECAGGPGGRWRTLWVLLLAAVVVVVWNAVFVVTGLVGGPPAPSKVERPAAVALPQPDADWVNLDAWRRTHPSWTPGP